MVPEGEYRRARDAVGDPDDVSGTATATEGRLDGSRYRRLVEKDAPTQHQRADDPVVEHGAQRVSKGLRGALDDGDGRCVVAECERHGGEPGEVYRPLGIDGL